MAKLKIYNPITDEEDKIILSDWFGLDSVCYKDITEFLESMDSDDNEIELLIHCPGGACMEGWAIYDKLRTSGKKITATIEGMCASMASVILLAAPKERRFGFENASLLIHNPAVRDIDAGTAERLTADELARLKGKLGAQEAALLEEQNKILDLYVDRTGADRNELQKLMNEDKFVTMDKAIELGFISSTVEPNTASADTHLNIKNMAKEEKVTIGSRVLNKLLSLAGFANVDDVNVHLDQNITAVDGSVFTVEREDGDPQIGDKAYPDGKYTVDDGTTIIIEGEVIKDIVKDTEDKAEKIAQLTVSLDEKTKQIEDINISLNATNEKYASLQGDFDEIADANNILRAENKTFKVDLDKANSDIESLKTTNADLTKEIEDLKSNIEALSAEKDALATSQKTDDEKEILDTVAKAGGKEWFDKVCHMQSTFHVGSRQFTAHGDKQPKGDASSKTKQMLEAKKAEFEEKKARLESNHK